MTSRAQLKTAVAQITTVRAQMNATAGTNEQPNMNDTAGNTIAGANEHPQAQITTPRAQMNTTAGTSHNTAGANENNHGRE